MVAGSGGRGRGGLDLEEDAVSRLSAKERKLRKEVLRIIRADNIVEDAAGAPSVRFALALILSCSADTKRAARVRPEDGI